MPEKPTKVHIRKRAYKPKVKTGCKTCRIRRVKCDEARPRCRRCESTGRNCDGYNSVSPTPSGERSGCETVQSDALVLSSRQSSPTITRLADTIPGNTHERRCFHFFQTRTAPELSGFFRSEFWQRLILQAAYWEPAIRHAAIALGSLHEEIQSSSVSKSLQDRKGTLNAFTLQQYGKAIHSLLEPVYEKGKQAADVALTTCVLFTCFESLQGNPDIALTHVQSGLNVLHDLKKGKAIASTGSPLVLNSSPYVPEDELQVLFTRLDMQAADLLDGDPEVWFMNYEPLGPCTMPSKFSSLEEAKNKYYEQQNCFKHGIRSIVGIKPVRTPMDIPELFPLRKTHRDLSERWSAALDAYLAQPDLKLDSKARQACLVLRIYHTIETAGLRLFPAESQLAHDECLREFELVVSLAESVIAGEGDNLGVCPPSLSVDVGINEPLFWVITRCRHPVVRRRALSTLRRAQRLEGVWDYRLAAIIAARVIEIEESGLENISGPEDIPAANRVRGICAKFRPGRQGFVSYVLEAQSENIEERFSW